MAVLSILVTAPARAEPAAAGISAQARPAFVPLPPGRPLHEAIDALVGEAAVGPLATRCTDADFVRRIHLDLAGVIPTVAKVRAFLADSAGDKRSKLVAELLADRAFARHMMFVLNAMLLERVTPPGDLATAWREYLFAALADDAPLDALARELLVSDGGEQATRPAATFLVARDAEPVQLTRAVGRLFFGRDLQCAQCHDHPLDDDIRQAEYQGLYAFFARTSLFRGNDKAVFVSERADGEVDYESVFTAEGERGVWPRLPGGATLLEEPRPEPAAAYAREPSKTSRGVPTFSRRAALADRLADDEGFRRNLANRIWAMFFGRGLVHPLDAIGRGNPPTHPRLLALLADTLRDNGFRLRPLVREIVLSETYQRSVEPPRPADVDAAGLQALITRLEAERHAAAGVQAGLERTATESEARRDAMAAKTHAVHLERLELVAARDAASQAADKATGAAAEAASTALATARAAVDAATARLGVDELAKAERAAIGARQAAVDAGHRLRRLDDRLQLARDLEAHAALAGSAPTAAEAAWESIVERWTVAGQVAPVRALSAEQLALSVQQATGALPARQASAAAAIDQAPPEQVAKAGDKDRPGTRAMQVEMRMVMDASGLLRSAADLFSDAISDGFQASVNQALYFGNSPDIQDQLVPSGQNLLAKLASLGDAGSVAEEAYGAVLSRPPTDEERVDVAAFIGPRTADRPQALAELVWALLSSNEFRFNH